MARLGVHAVMFLCLLCIAQAAMIVKPFKVIPWRDDKVSAVSPSGKQCFFDWRGHGSGEDEEWTLELNERKNQELICEVRRLKHGPNSHTKFVAFRLTLEGVKEIVSAEVFDHTGALLREEDFVVQAKGDKGTVSSTRTWAQQLDKLVVKGTLS